MNRTQAIAHAWHSCLWNWTGD